RSSLSPRSPLGAPPSSPPSPPFFFPNAAPPAILPLSLHDALPIWSRSGSGSGRGCARRPPGRTDPPHPRRSRSPAPPDCRPSTRSEEHTSELQSLTNLVCRLLLDKKKPPPCLTHPAHQRNLTPPHP